MSSPVFSAIVAGDTAGLQVAIDAGESVNEFDESPQVPLVFAAQRGLAALVSVLVSNGADLDTESGKQKNTALMLAAYNGHPNVVGLLIEAGADLYLVNDFTETARECAVQDKTLKHAEALRLLLEAGMPPRNPETLPCSTMMDAARSGNVKAIEHLVVHGADVNEVREFGTALTTAAEENQIKVAEYLLSQNADPALVITHGDLEGKTAVGIAKEHGRRKLVALFGG